MLSHGSDSATAVADFAAAVGELEADRVALALAVGEDSDSLADALELDEVDALCPQAARAKAEQATTAMATGFIPAYVSTHLRHQSAGACGLLRRRRDCQRICPAAERRSDV